ncbi:MAG: hypothetical protein FWD06_02835 [Oscillospiraceae bacterium]|nr:hypothetical protein [Oscillospiraceae bacterium]
MKPSDLQRLAHIKQYCEDVADAILTFGNDFDAFENNRHFVNAVSMCIMQIGELTGMLSPEFKEQNALLWDR